jgi:hypothetical protein
MAAQVEPNAVDLDADTTVGALRFSAMSIPAMILMGPYSRTDGWYLSMQKLGSFLVADDLTREISCQTPVPAVPTVDRRVDNG